MRSKLPPTVLFRALLLSAVLSATVDLNASGMNLVNKTLRGCALLEFPYVKHSDFGHESTQGFTGVAIDYFMALRDRVGFKVQLSLWNSTFREFVDHMGSCASKNGTSENCACDIGVGAFTMTNDRVKKIDFLWAFSNENHRMVGRASDLSADGDGNLSYMFNTFSWEVWALISVAVLFYAAGTAAFGDIAPVNRDRYPAFRPILRARRTRDAPSPPSPSPSPAFKRARSGSAAGDISASSVTVHLPPEGYPSAYPNGTYPPDDISYGNSQRPSSPRPKKDESPHLFTRLAPRLQRLGVAMVYTFGMFIGHPQDTDSTRVSSIHRVAWRLLSITAGVFLFCLYNASLTVLLFESVKESRFRTLEDVKDCVVHPQSVTFIRGGASEDLWNNAITKRGFCRTPHRPRVRADSIEHGLQLLREGRADFFYSLEGSVLSVVHRQCDEFVVVGEPFFSTSVGFIVPKGSVLESPLSEATRILREQDAFQSARTLAMRNACKDTSAATIHLSRLMFFFVAYFVAAFVLIAYRVYFVHCT